MCYYVMIYTAVTIYVGSAYRPTYTTENTMQKKKTKKIYSYDQYTN